MRGLISMIICTFLSACYECYSDSCWQQKERARFLMLSPEKQIQKRNECMQWLPMSCYTYSRPTKEELEELQIDNNSN